VGDTLVLNATAESLVELRCGEVSLTKGRMGKVGHAVALRVEAPLNAAAKNAMERFQ
jgi:flagellar motor switch protein FliM